MNYKIYFDESNKLDQPNGGYSYYGAFGTSEEKMGKILDALNCMDESKSEMHFAKYNKDTYFGKYFNSLNYVIKQDINLNIMIVNNDEAKIMSQTMGVTTKELRNLFYVKIPERLFYGVTRDLENMNEIKITLDENDEYGLYEVEEKIAEQMNAHSLYRNKGYKIQKIDQESSDKSVPLQLVDVFMGIVVFLLEKQYKYIGVKQDDVVLKIKSDLIYRFLTQDDNLNLFQNKIKLFKWEGNNDKIQDVNISDFTAEFIVDKTRYDIQEMNRLQRLRLDYPDETTKFYREKMEYTNRELRILLGYMDEIDGKGRNSFFMQNQLT